MKENPSESIFDFDEEEIELHRYIITGLLPEYYFEIDARYADKLTVDRYGKPKINDKYL